MVQLQKFSPNQFNLLALLWWTDVSKINYKYHRSTAQLCQTRIHVYDLRSALFLLCWLLILTHFWAAKGVCHIISDFWFPHTLVDIFCMHTCCVSWGVPCKFIVLVNNIHQFVIPIISFIQVKSSYNNYVYIESNHHTRSWKKE